MSRWSACPRQSWRCSLKAAESCDHIQPQWWKPLPRKRDEVGRLVSDSEGDETEAKAVFHTILINLSSLSLWLGEDAVCCSPQTLRTHPLSSWLREGLQPWEEAHFSPCWVQSCLWGGVADRLPWTLAVLELHFSLKGYLGKHKAWVLKKKKRHFPTCRNWKVLHSKGLGNC